MTIRVLIADDHTMIREGLKALLAAMPDISMVGEVDNGREAVERTQALAPDVLVMDISMPELNGIDAANVLREKCPGVRIVMLSMHSTSEHVFRAFEAGCSGYLLKDSASSELETAVRAVYAGRRYVSQAIALREPAVNAGSASPLDSLSARERQVLQLVVEGWSSAEIAARIHLSPKTVETYRSRLMGKLGVKDITSLVRFAIEHGLTPGS